MRISKLAAVVGSVGSLVGAVVACGGCSSSTASDGGGSGPPISCTVAANPMPASGLLTGLDETCLGGPTVRQILALVRPSYTSTLTVQNTPATPPAKTSLTIGISYGGAAATCASQQDNPPGHGSSSPNGYATVDVPVTMTFKTDDGSFDDTLPVTLTFNCSRQPNETVATVALAGTLPAAMHKGTYAPLPGTVELYFTGNVGGTTNGLVGNKSPQFSGGGGTWM